LSRQFVALLTAVLIGACTLYAPPAPSQAAYALSADEVVSLVCAPQFAWDCETALAITWRESNWQPHAYNPSSGCAGLWQLSPIHHARVTAHGWLWSDTYDPSKNTVIAYELWLESGWYPWRY